MLLFNSHFENKENFIVFQKRIEISFLIAKKEKGHIKTDTQIKKVLGCTIAYVKRKKGAGRRYEATLC